MREYLKTRWQSWVMAAAMLLMAVIVLFLYDVPLEPVGYIAVLVIICETGFLIWGYCKYRKKRTGCSRPSKRYYVRRGR